MPFWHLLLALASAGSLSAPADQMGRLRAAVAYPEGSACFGVLMNAEGEFSFIGESTSGPHRRPIAPRPASKHPADTLAALAEGCAGHPMIGSSVDATGFAVCRRCLETDPTDVRAMIRLGEYLDRAGQWDEAEKWYRRATATAPRDWETWHALAAHLTGRAVGELLKDEVPPGPLPVGQLFRTLGPDARKHLRSDLLWCRANGRWNAERRLREANDCFDWAVLFAPVELGAHLGRLQWNLTLGLLVMEEQVGQNAHALANILPLRPLTPDARRVAELSDHPMAYGFSLLAGGDPDRGPEAAGREWKRYAEQVAGRLEALRRHPDPGMRLDATRILVMVRCAATQDFAEAERLLNELPVEAGDPVLLQLAHVVYGGHKDGAGMIRLLERRLLLKADPYDSFLLAVCRERAGQMRAALAATKDGLRHSPNDPRLNLMRAALLLQYGSGADLLEAHLRLCHLERTLGARLARPGSDPLTADEHLLYRQVWHNRAVYFGLTGQRPAAMQHAVSAYLGGGADSEDYGRLFRALDRGSESPAVIRPTSGSAIRAPFLDATRPASQSVVPVPQPFPDKTPFLDRPGVGSPVSTGPR